MCNYSNVPSRDGVLRVAIKTAEPVTVYIHPSSGKVLVAMDRSRAAYAWLYYMVHTYNYPGLSDRPVIRITILLIPLTLGFAFSISGLLVSVRRLRATATSPALQMPRLRSGPNRKI